MNFFLQMINHKPALAGQMTFYKNPEVMSGMQGLARSPKHFLLLDTGPLGPVSSKAMHLPTGYLCGWLAMWGFSRRADATMATASFAK